MGMASSFCWAGRVLGAGSSSSAPVPIPPSQELPGAAGAALGSLPPALRWQRDTELTPAPSPPDPLLPPRWDRAPRKGLKGDLYRSQLLKQTRHTHTHHRVQQNSVQTRFTHTRSVCARLTRYSTAGARAGEGRRWLRYCTGVNVNNAASSERASQDQKNSCFVQKCP